MCSFNNLGKYLDVSNTECAQISDFFLDSSVVFPTSIAISKNARRTRYVENKYKYL